MIYLTSGGRRNNGSSKAEHVACRGPDEGRNLALTEPIVGPGSAVAVKRTVGDIHDTGLRKDTGVMVEEMTRSHEMIAVHHGGAAFGLFQTQNQCFFVLLWVSRNALEVI